MKCPRDGRTLERQRYEDQVEVDACPLCRGVWLDKGELEAIEARVEHHPSEEFDEDVPLDAIDHVSHPIRCPKCGGEMETREHGYCSRVYVDTCIEGCGVWLDTGELAALEKFYEGQQQHEDSEDVVTYLYVSLLSVFHRPKRARKPGANG